jgi:uncharacterized ferredoxin-like protein
MAEKQAGDTQTEDSSQFVWKSDVEYRPVMKLDDDMLKAFEKMQMIDDINDGLPGLDCGACGAPSCRALAEDIVRGIAKETDCIFKLREKVSDIAKELNMFEG